MLGLARAAQRAVCSLGGIEALRRRTAAASERPAAAGLLCWPRQTCSPSKPSFALALPARTFAAGPAVHAVAPEVLRKARRMSAPTGLLAGLFGSVVGVGGGVVIVPIIVSACRSIPQRLVSGTSLAAVLATAVTSAAAYAQAGCVDAAAVAIISPLALLTAPLGALMTAHLNCAALRRTLGIFLICAAPLVPLKAYLLYRKEQGAKALHASLPLTPQAAPEGETLKTPITAAPLASEPAPWMVYWDCQRQALAAMPPATVAMLVGTGAVAGFASGLLGIGGGTIVTPLLALVMPYGQLTVLGTSLLSMVPPSLAALAQHTRMGNVDWRLAAGLAAGTAAGAALGSAAAVNAPPGVLEGCFAVGMALLGRKTLQTAK